MTAAHVIDNHDPEEIQKGRLYSSGVGPVDASPPAQDMLSVHVLQCIKIIHYLYISCSLSVACMLIAYSSGTLYALWPNNIHCMVHALVSATAQQDFMYVFARFTAFRHCCGHTIS